MSDQHVLRDGWPMGSYDDPTTRSYGDSTTRSYGDPTTRSYGDPTTRSAAVPIRRARATRTAPDHDQVVVVTLDVPRIQTTIWLITGTLIALDFVASAAVAQRLLPYTITRFFDGDDKVNFPTGAKTTLLLAAVLLLLGCWRASSRRPDPTTRGWLLLAAVTAFAFIDETTFLHQSISGVLSDKYHFTGILKFAWTLLYAPAGVLVGIFILRNLRHLRPQIRNRVLPGGIIYVLGAIFLEPVKSHLATTSGDGSLAFKLTAAVSDSMELAGLAMLVCGLLHTTRLLTAGFSFALNTDT
jgi:hypothetical protein